jgi:hypothetical protein
MTDQEFEAERETLLASVRAEMFAALTAFIAADNVARKMPDYAHHWDFAALRAAANQARLALGLAGPNKQLAE